MKTTANFKLKKPDLTDVADIEVLNSNSDILDKIIKDLQNAQFTEQQARQIFALISHRHNTSDINNLTTTIQQTKVNSAGYADNAGRANNAINADKLKNMIFHWSGQGGQPPWLWGGSDGTNMYVYNPSNFNVNHANTAGSANSVQGFQFRNNNGQLEVLVGGVWLSVGSKQYTVVRKGKLVRLDGTFQYRGGPGAFRYGASSGNCYAKVIIDDQNREEFSVGDGEFNFEFKNSIKITLEINVSESYTGYNYVVQTEK